MFVFEGSLDVNFPLNMSFSDEFSIPAGPVHASVTQKTINAVFLSEGNSAPAALAAASSSSYNYLACLNLTPASVKTYFSFSDTAEHWPRAPWRAGAVILFCDPPQILTHISTNETHYTNCVSVSHCHAY